MGIKRYTATKDATITNAYKANLVDRGTRGNMGESDVLEMFSIYAQTSSGSLEKARILLQFPIGDVIADRSAAKIPNSGSVNFFLKLYNAPHGQTTPEDYKVTVQAVSGTSWDEGHGLDMEDYNDESPVNWLSASSDKIAQVVRTRFESVASADYSSRYISLYNGLNNRYNFWFRTAANTSAPAIFTGTLVEVDIKDVNFNNGATTKAAIATAFKLATDNAVKGFSSLVKTESGLANIVNVTNVKANAANDPIKSVDDSVTVCYTEITGASAILWKSCQLAEPGGGDFHSASYNPASPGYRFPTYNDTRVLTASADLEIDITAMVEEWVRGATMNPVKSNYGLSVRLSGSYENGEMERSYYTKKFFARGSEFFYKRPVIEARFDSALTDDRTNLYKKTDNLSATDNLNTIYLYNRVRGQLKDIAALTDNLISVSLYTSSAGWVDDYSGGGDRQLAQQDANNDGTLDNPAAIVAGGKVYGQTGIYSASFAYPGNETKLYDIWYTGAGGSLKVFKTGSFDVKTDAVIEYLDEPEIITKITNLKNSYSRQDRTRLRVYTRADNWCPNIYTVASKKADVYTVEQGYYSIRRTSDNLEVVSFGTGSTNHTKLSYDPSGSYFDLDMSLFEKDYAYEISFMFKVNDNFMIQKDKFKFRVD